MPLCPFVPLSLALFLAVGLPGCWSDARREVVVYAALDREFSGPVLERYAAEQGVEVRPKYDIESTKTVGLTTALLAEADRPRCDVFWNNEILNTLRLEKQGLLDAYAAPAAAAYPAAFRDPKHRWHAFAARARVLLINTNRVPPDLRPGSILDLTDVRWRGQVALAKPLFGTTATHAACLFAIWGDAKASAWFRAVQANDVQVLAGNKQVAQQVGRGQVAWGLTDTDDAWAEVAAGSPVEMIYPDQGPDGLGTLFIPNTLAIIRGGPNPDEARRLVEHLLSPEVERALAEGESRQIPLNPRVAVPPELITPAQVRAMAVDFREAAAAWDATAASLRSLFTE